jgi:hypothetical protein
MSEKIHSWHADGTGATEVTLAPGDYRLISHQDAQPLPEATEPRTSLPSDDGLSVTDPAGAVVLKGPGSFKVADAGTYRITFGEPRVAELWSIHFGELRVVEPPADAPKV